TTCSKVLISSLVDVEALMTTLAPLPRTNLSSRVSAALRLKRVAQGTLLATALAALFAEVPGHATTIAQNPLPYSKGFLVTGNYVVAGVDLPKTSASGTITIGGVPDNADIVGAYLYWESTSSVDTGPALAGVTFRTNPLYGTNTTTGQPMPLVPIKRTVNTQLPG